MPVSYCQQWPNWLVALRAWRAPEHGPIFWFVLFPSSFHLQSFGPGKKNNSAKQDTQRRTRTKLCRICKCTKSRFDWKFSIYLFCVCLFIPRARTQIRRASLFHYCILAVCFVWFLSNDCLVEQKTDLVSVFQRLNRDAFGEGPTILTGSDGPHILEQHFWIEWWIGKPACNVQLC